MMERVPERRMEPPPEPPAPVCPVCGDECWKIYFRDGEAVGCDVCLTWRYADEMEDE